MVPDEGWVKILNQKWDRNIVSEETSKFTELSLQSETEQRPHKLSFYVQKDKAQDIMKALSARLEERGLDVKIIYSGGQDLDILPQGAGKGQALAYLLQKFKSDGKLPKNTLVCGDSGNDAELFSIPDVHGVMVSNAQEELLQWHAANANDNPIIIHATERCAAGIIQAIGHFNLGPNTSARDVTDLSDSKMDNFDPGYEVVKLYLFYERWRCGEVEHSELYLAKLNAVCGRSGIFVHPSGVEQLLRDCVDSLKPCYGDKHGKQFRVWVDQVLPVKIMAGEVQEMGAIRRRAAILSDHCCIKLKGCECCRRAHLGACTSDLVGWSRAKRSFNLVILDFLVSLVCISYVLSNKCCHIIALIIDIKIREILARTQVMSR